MLSYYPPIIIILNNPNRYTATTPYKITVPANLKIFAPIPKTKPSVLYSKAADVIECAKPVIGIIKALLTLVTIMSNTPIAVKKEAVTIKVKSTITPYSFLGM